MRRRVELYSVDLFISVAVSKNGDQCKYKSDGFTFSERWCGVKDSTLIDISYEIGLITAKTHKILESINWMRNHASGAHENSEEIKYNDVVSFALLIKENLLAAPNPKKINTPSKLMDDIKNIQCTEEKISLISQDAMALPNKLFLSFVDFLVGTVCSGEEPGSKNSTELMKIIWPKVPTSKRSEIGLKYQQLVYENVGKESANKVKQERLFELLISLDACEYIPDTIREMLFNRYAEDLDKAKNTTYGWANETAAALSLRQLGLKVPDASFDKLYSEILAVYCGNRWGRSTAYINLNEYIFTQTKKNMVRIAKLFVTSNRANSEMLFDKPKEYAIQLLTKIKENLAIISQQNEIDEVIRFIKNYKI